MRSVKIRVVDKKRMREKPDFVIKKLMNLGGPENGEELSEGGEATSFLKRDFEIREWDWPRGVGLYDLLRIMQVWKSEDYREFLYQWFKDNTREGLPSKNINTTAPPLTLVRLNEYYYDQEFEALYFKWADWLINCLPGTMERRFQHVTSVSGDHQGVRLNEDEMWTDTILVTVLLFNQIGQKYQNQSWTDESIHRMLMHIRYLWDEETGLLYRGWAFNEKNNFGGVFRCRGNNRFTLGTPDYTSMLKGTVNVGVKEFMVDIYKIQVEALKGLQGKSGLRRTVLISGGSYEGVSGSATITTGVLKGIRYGVLDDSYPPCAWRAVEAILDNIDRNGTVLNVSGDTSMGYDADHYKNILTTPTAYRRSLTILALAEASLHLG